jgi:hypothetical protein
LNSCLFTCKLDSAEANNKVSTNKEEEENNTNKMQEEGNIIIVIILIQFFIYLRAELNSQWPIAVSTNTTITMTQQ